MLKTKTLFSALFILLMGLTTVIAAPEADKAKAKAVIIKTNTALGVTHMTVKRTRKFTGKLGKAVKHERFAKKQYLAGNYDKSIYHSLYARKLATEVMQENNAKTITVFNFAPDETALMSSSPSAEDLTKEVNADDPADVKDEDLMNGNLDLNVN